VINRVVRHFQYLDPQEVLQVAIDTDDTGVMVGESYRVGKGSILEIDTELLFITEWDQTNKIATVIRGWMGTTVTSHSLSAMITVNPRVLRSDVLDLFNMCLIELYPALVKVDTQDLTYDSDVIGYALDADADRVLAVYGRVGSAAGNWEKMRDLEKLSNMPIAYFATGQALMVRSALPLSAPIRVIFSCPFTKLSSEAGDLEATAGLQDYMTDLPYYFAMSRLLVGKEIDRSQIAAAQAHQRAQDVPGFLALRTGEWYQARYDDLKRICQARQRVEVSRITGGGYGG